MFEVQTRFVHGWENVWTEDDVPLLFDDQGEANQALAEHLEDCRIAGVSVTSQDFRIVPRDK